MRSAPPPNGSFLRGVLPALLGAALAAAPACTRPAEPSSAEQALAATVEGLDRARNERTLNLLEQLRTSMTRFSIDNEGTFPEGSSLSGISGQLAPRYMPLVVAEDAWGHTMTYASDGRSYSIVSAGPDGISGTPDDIALRDGAVSGGTGAAQ